MDAQSRTTAPARAVLRRLADVRTEKKGVLTIYADLDPQVFPTPPDRQAQIDSLISEAEEAYANADVSHDEQRSRKAAVDSVREALNDPDLVKGGVRGVAVFAAPSEDLLHVVRLDAPVPPTVVVDDAPYLRPLADEAGPRTWAFLLTDRRTARILYGGHRRLVEVANFSDKVMSRPTYGGWSQARYQRHHEDAARQHFENAIETLSDFFDVVPFEALAIAAPDPLYNEVVDKLPPPLAERVRGRVRVEIDFPSPTQVLEAAEELFDEARTRALDDIFDSLEERDRSLVATGADATLRALHERRVMTLVLSDGVELKGVRCPQCEFLGLAGKQCPYDGTATDEREDLVGDAIDMALMQAARVVQVPVDAERQPPEPICALLRY